MSGVLLFAAMQFVGVPVTVAPSDPPDLTRWRMVIEVGDVGLSNSIPYRSYLECLAALESDQSRFNPKVTMGRCEPWGKKP